MVLLTTGTVCTAAYATRVAPDLNDRLRNGLISLNWKEIFSLASLALLTMDKPHLAGGISTATVVVLEGVEKLQERLGKDSDSSLVGKITMLLGAVALACASLLAGGLLTTMYPNLVFTSMATLAVSAHLAGAIRQKASGAFGNYSPSTLNPAQLQQKKEIEEMQQRITEQAKRTEPVVVKEATLPPGQPTTFTVPKTTVHNVPRNQPLPAVLLNALTSQIGAPVQPLPVVAKAIDRDEAVDIVVCVQAPERGSQLDDEALYDRKHYGEKRIVVKLGENLKEIKVNLQPPKEVRPYVKYVPLDAVNGKPTSQATGQLKLQWDGGKRTINAELNGTFELRKSDLPSGTHVVNYTFEVEGYVSKTDRFVSHDGLLNDAELKVPLSRQGQVTLPERFEPVGHIAQLRVVLKWGAHPSDLDLHCAISKPVPIGNDRTGSHMYFDLKGNGGEMRLDKDDQSGNGHETLTLDKLQPDVTYWFGVHHYRGQGNLASSAASIEVYGLTPGILAEAGRGGADHSPFLIKVPSSEVQGCGENGVWRCFGLVHVGDKRFKLVGSW
jgi:hypothetical protein